jgi:putative aldouronate transport system substrate-binding protein
MKMQRPRLLFAGLFLALFLSFGYGGARQQDEKSEATGIPAQSSPAIPGTVKYPVSNQIVKLSYWMPISISAMQHIASYAENTAYQEIQKRTGVQIQFIHPALGQEREQYNIMIASGDLPDIIQNQNTSYYDGGLLKAYEDGVYIDLLPQLRKNAPDYYKYINSSIIAEKQTHLEGKVLAFYLMKPNNPPYHRPILRKDWSNEFGLGDTLRTYDEWEKYFQGILARKPGVAPMHINFNAAGDLDLWLGAFDMLSTWYIVNGKVTHYYDNPRYKEFLVKMNQWYEKGYITKDFVSLSDTQVFALFDSGRIGGYNGAVDTVRYRTLPLKLPINSAPNPRLGRSQKLHTEIPMWPIDPNLQMPTSITTQCKDIESAIKFLNYGYTEEGSLIYNFGTEGKSYIMVKGEPKFTDLMLNNPNGLTSSNVSYIYKIHLAPKWSTPDTKGIPGVAKDQEGVAWRLQWADDPDLDDTYRMLPVIPTPAEIEEYTSIMVDVGAYANEMKLKFIVGAEPLSNFNAYINRLNALKFQRAKAIQQAGYDRLMK